VAGGRGGEAGGRSPGASGSVPGRDYVALNPADEGCRDNCGVRLAGDVASAFRNLILATIISWASNAAGRGLWRSGEWRDECLNGEIFYSLREAQMVIEKWRVQYNTKRLHNAPGYGPPAPRGL